MLVRIPQFCDTPTSELLYGDDLGLVRCCLPSALGPSSCFVTDLVLGNSRGDLSTLEWELTDYSYRWILHRRSPCCPWRLESRT
jgi:hypothetical protein